MSASDYGYGGLIAHVRSFRLFRSFFAASFIGVTVVTLTLAAFIRLHTVSVMVEQGGRSNADITRAFANVLWEPYRAFGQEAGRRSHDDLLDDTRVEKLDASIRALSAGTKVVRVKIYDLAGVTIFSSDRSQIGEDKSSNPGFKRALAGELTSGITHRDSVDTFEGQLADRDLIFSYVPVSLDGRAITAVFEVYSDVTDLLAANLTASWRGITAVWLLLSALFLFLLFVVHRADRIIRSQRADLEAGEARVRHLAYHDTLTGLPNRASFGEHLNRLVSTKHADDRRGALMFIDLDHFKSVNDTLGHEAGDALLREVSGRIASALRDVGLVFRVGGDEFTAILTPLTSADDAAKAARRIQRIVARPVLLAESSVKVGATIGIAIYPGDGASPAELLKAADAAMYAAKARGRGSFALFGECEAPLAVAS